MISRINNNSFFKSSDGLDSEVESKENTSQNSLITETAFPASHENGKDHWSITSQAKDSSMIDVLVSQVKEPTSMEVPNLKSEKKKP